LVGESQALSLVGGEFSKRIARGMRTGRFNDQAAALSRLMSGTSAVRQTTISYELAGPDGVAWADEDDSLGQRGVGFLMRQTSCIGGGTPEMSRNVVSDRVLGMPRERTGDRDIAFRDVPKGPSSK